MKWACHFKKNNCQYVGQMIKFELSSQVRFLENLYLKRELESFSDEISDDIGLRRPKSRCQPGLALICWLWEEFASNLIQVVGQILFLAVVGSRFPFPWWQSVKGHSQLLEDLHIPHHMSAFYLWANNGTSPFSCFDLWLPLGHQLEKALLKGLSLDWVHPNNLLIFKSTDLGLYICKNSFTIVPGLVFDWIAWGQELWGPSSVLPTTLLRTCS